MTDAESETPTAASTTVAECPLCRVMLLIPAASVKLDLTPEARKRPCPQCGYDYDPVLARWRTIVSNRSDAVMAFMSDIVDIKDFAAEVGKGWPFKFSKEIPVFCGAQFVLSPDAQAIYELVATDVSPTGLTVLAALKPAMHGEPTVKVRCIVHGRLTFNEQEPETEFLWEAKQCVARKDFRTQVTLCWAAFEAWLNSEFGGMIDGEKRMDHDLKDEVVAHLDWRFKLRQVTVSEGCVDGSARDQLEKVWKLRCKIAHGRRPVITETDAQSAFATIVSLMMGVPPWAERRAWGWWGIGQPRPDFWG